MANIFQQVFGGPGQNAHYATKLAFVSGCRLRERYNRGAELTNAAVARELDEIQAFIASQAGGVVRQENYPGESAHIYAAANRFLGRVRNAGVNAGRGLWGEPVAFGAAECLNDAHPPLPPGAIRARYISAPDLHPRELLALTWLGIKDANVPCAGGIQKTPEEILNLKRSFIIALMEGQRAYNTHRAINVGDYAQAKNDVILPYYDRYIGYDVQTRQNFTVESLRLVGNAPIPNLEDRPACINGTFSKCIEALNLSHPDVSVEGWVPPPLNLNEINLIEIAVSTEDMGQRANTMIAGIKANLTAIQVAAMEQFDTRQIQLPDGSSITGQDILDDVMMFTEPAYLYFRDLANPQINPAFASLDRNTQFKITTFANIFAPFLTQMQTGLLTTYGNALTVPPIHPNGITTEQMLQLLGTTVAGAATAPQVGASAAAASTPAPAPAAAPLLPARPVVAAGAIPAGYIPGNEGRLLGFYANRIRRDDLPWFGAPIVRLTNVAEVGPAPGVPGPYHQMHLPQVPVVHPYNPAGDQRIDAGTPQFSFSTTLPQGTVSNLPPAVSALLIQENLDLRNVQCAISMQNKPWNTAVTPLLLRPQPWLHPNAPAFGPHNSVSNIRMAVASVGSHIGPLRAFNNVLTHNEVAGAPVVYSPNSMRLQGLHNENTTDQFYSICIEPAHGGQPARAVITFHTLLSDADQRQVNNILQDPALAINTPENFFAAIAAGGGGINTEELTAFARGGRNLAVESAALVASTITLADGAPVYRDDPLAAAAPARAAGSGAAAAGPAPAAAPRPAPAPQAMPAAPTRQTTQQLADELENRYGAVRIARRQDNANLVEIQRLLVQLRAELEHAPMDVQNALSTHSSHAIIVDIDQDVAEIFQARLAAIPITRNAAEQQALAQLRADLDIAPPAIREVLLRNVNRRFAEDLAARVQAAAPPPAAAPAVAPAAAPAAAVPVRPALTADQIRANAVLARLGRPPQYF